MIPALLLAAVAAGCSRSEEGTLGVQLVYPSPPPATVAAPADPPSASTAPSTRAPSYATDPSNRILIRVLAPHFAPIERWFDRSDGRGEIPGVPAGDRITVEVDEYDNTAATLGTGAPLRGRGWYHGVTLSAGETKTVPVPMYAKGTIVTVCGTPGAAGDNTTDGILAAEASLGNPTAVKAAPDGSIYVSSSAYKKVKKIDRFGYISPFAGNGTDGIISTGALASSSPVGSVTDIDLDPSGNVYLFNFNDNNQIIRIDNGVITSILLNGQYGVAARPNIAVVNDNLVYFVNYIDRRVYRIFGTLKSDFVMDNTPHQIFEPIDRFHYPIIGPSSITYASKADSLVFAATDNNRIMRVNFNDGYVYYLVGNATGGVPFSEGIDPLEMVPQKPRVVDYNPITGKIFFVEDGAQQILYIDNTNRVRKFAGTGIAGYDGDGVPAIQARLYDPRAITVDSRGNAYIADYGNHAVRMVVGGALP